MFIKGISDFRSTVQLQGSSVMIMALVLINCMGGYSLEGSDPITTANTYQVMDGDGDGFTTDEGDCDDTDPNINPDATDIANNGIDEDCDGSDYVLDFSIRLEEYVECGDPFEPADLSMPFEGVTSCEDGPIITYEHDDTQATLIGCLDEALFITRTWTATDECGRTFQKDQLIYLVDTEAPVIECVTNISVFVDEEILASNIVTSTTDNCEGSTSVSLETTRYTECDDDNTVANVVTVTDDCGNASTCTVAVTVVCHPSDNCPNNLTCNDRVQISLGDDCEATINPHIILKDDMAVCNGYRVRIKDLNQAVLLETDDSGANILYPVLDYTYVGSTWIAEVYYLNPFGVEIPCWGEIVIEDKLKPTVNCEETIDVSCSQGLEQVLEMIQETTVEDNCGGGEILILDDVLDASDCGPEGITAVRYIKYVAVDAGGTQSDTCSVAVNYSGTNLNSVRFPANYEAQCDTLSVELTPDLTGRPSVGNMELDLQENLCKLNITFTDDTTSVCNPHLQILRNWVVLDWCAGEYISNHQTISIIDVSGPAFECPESFTIIANSGCDADYVFEPLDTLSMSVIGRDADGLPDLVECSGYSLAVEYLIGDEYVPGSTTQPWRSTVGSNNMYTANGLAVGDNKIRYVGTDSCENESSCVFTVTVVDGTPPVPVCDEFTAVSLADDGWGRIYGISLDDGSFDACGGDLVYQVRRDSSICDTLLMDRDDTVFGDYVQFCCQEAGQTVPVYLQVSDLGGAANTCMVNVVVQDKHNGVSFSCPDVDPKNCLFVEEPTEEIRPQPFETCATIDSIYFTDNTSGLDPQCLTGTFERDWFAIVSGAVIHTGCTQEIEIIPVVITDVDFPEDREATCADWEMDLGPLPTVNGEPADQYEGCGNIGFTYRDNVFEDVDGFCVKVIRTWTVIDWCQYDISVSLTAGKWESRQIIYVSNADGPEVTGCPEDITVNAANNDCTGEAFIPTPSAMDLCFGEAVPLSKFSWSIPSIDTIGTGNLGSITLPLGEHTVVWSITDRCSAVNQGDNACSVLVSVVDTEKPVPYCRSLVTTVVTTIDPATGTPCTEIWASDFNLGALDNCDQFLTVSFSDTLLTDTRRKYDCNSLGAHTLRVYFTDDDGNQDFCITTVEVQVNSNICDTIGSITVIDIEGDIYTEQDQMIDNVAVGLEEMTTSNMNQTNTDADGHFAFSNITAQHDYRLVATDNVDHLNGVSTLDLVMIQRHILGIEHLDSPYKVIAADINNSGDINGIDLVELRKLILGVYDVLPQNNSWRFVDQEQIFADILSPWPIKEDIQLTQVNGDMMNNDFIGVKIGDVNGTVVMSLEDGAIANRNNPIGITTEILSLVDDSEYLIPVYFDQDVNTYGMQFAIMSEMGVELTGYESGRLDLSDSDISITDNRFMLSYVSHELLDLDSDEALFYLTVKADHTLDNRVFDMDYKNMAAEIYDENLRIAPIKMSENFIADEFVLYQNMPNPFSDVTSIEFEVPTYSDLTLTILDINGRVIKAITGQYEKGRHAIVVSEKELTRNGVYYFKLETDSFSATRKMIRVD